MNTPIVEVREKRKAILLVLSTAIFLALAINFATLYLSIKFSEQPLQFLLLSAVCFLAGILLLQHMVFGISEHIVRLEGAISYKFDGKILEPVRIVGYKFNDDFCLNLRGFIHENKAYSRLFSNRTQSSITANRFDPDNVNHHTIVKSVLEFTVLSELALHLNSYFTKNEIDRSSIVELTRNQLGAEVLKNRVIDQLTRDMKERPAFSPDFYSDTNGEVVYALGGNGLVYDRLTIELPPNSSITRNSLGYLVISNRLFSLTIIPKYKGSTIMLPGIFARSEDDFLKPLLISINMHIRIKNTILLLHGSMAMYEWLDSFIERMRDYISTNRLTQRLDADLVQMLTLASTDLKRDQKL